MKKFLSVVFIFTFTFLFGAENIDFVIPVVNEAEVKTLTDILQAVSMILYSNAENGALNYEALLKLIFTFGSFLVFTNIVFMTSGQMQGLQSYVTYNAVVVGILSIIYSTKANVMITTNNISEAPAGCVQGSVVTTDFVVIPYVLGYGIKVMDSIGTNLTQMFETAMYQPEGKLGTPAILDGGFGQNLDAVSSMLKLGPQDKVSSELNHNIAKFMEECVNKGLYASEINKPIVMELYKSSLIHSYIKDNIISSSDPLITGQMDSIWAENHNGIWKTCRNLWNDDISDTKVYTSIDGLICKIPGTNPEGSIEFLLNKTGGAAASMYSNTKDLFVQAAMINASRNSIRNSSVGITGLDYAIGKTKAEAVVNSVQGSSYMVEMLPYMTVVFKGLIYAVFPFILVLMILPGGGAIFKQYLKSVLWIQMWLPTAAILNYFIYGYTEQKAQMLIGTEGLNLTTSPDMLSSSATLAGVAGMLYLSIPAVSWLFLTGSAQMMGNLTGAVGASLAKNANSESAARDVGDVQKMKDVEKLTGQHMSFAEMDAYQSRQMGTSGAASIAAHKMTNGFENQRAREFFEKREQMLTTDKVIESGVTPEKTSGVNAGAKIEAVTQATVNHKMTEDGQVNTEVLAASGAQKGTEEYGNLQQFLDKFDTDGKKGLSPTELNNATKFAKDNKGLSYAQLQSKINAVDKNKDGIDSEDLKNYEKTMTGVENRNLIKSEEDNIALENMGQRELDKAVKNGTITQEEANKMSKQDIMNMGARIASKVDASTNAAQAEAAYNVVGGDMKKLEQIKGAMTEIGLAGDAGNIAAVATLGGGSFDKGLKEFTKATEGNAISRDAQTLGAMAEAGSVQQFMEYKKELGEMGMVADKGNITAFKEIGKENWQEATKDMNVKQKTQLLQEITSSGGYNKWKQQIKDTTARQTTQTITDNQKANAYGSEVREKLKNHDLDTIKGKIMSDPNLAKAMFGDKFDAKQSFEENMKKLNNTELGQGMNAVTTMNQAISGDLKTAGVDTMNNTMTDKDYNEYTRKEMNDIEQAKAQNKIYNSLSDQQWKAIGATNKQISIMNDLKKSNSVQSTAALMQMQSSIMKSSEGRTFRNLTTADGSVIERVTVDKAGNVSTYKVSAEGQKQLLDAGGAGDEARLIAAKYVSEAEDGMSLKNLAVGLATAVGVKKAYSYFENSKNGKELMKNKEFRQMIHDDIEAANKNGVKGSNVQKNSKSMNHLNEEINSKKEQLKTATGNKKLELEKEIKGLEKDRQTLGKILKDGVDGKDVRTVKEKLQSSFNDWQKYAKQNGKQIFTNTAEFLKSNAGKVAIGAMIDGTVFSPTSLGEGSDVVPMANKNRPYATANHEDNQEIKQKFLNGDSDMNTYVGQTFTLVTGRNRFELNKDFDKNKPEGFDNPQFVEQETKKETHFTVVKGEDNMIRKDQLQIRNEETGEKTWKKWEDLEAIFKTDRKDDDNGYSNKGI